MKTLFKFSVMQTVRFSLLISLVFSFVIAEIEMLDYIEFGGKEILGVLATSFFAYLPDIFFLSVPVSAFRFFSAKRKELNFLFIFGVSRLRIFLMFFLFGAPVFAVSTSFFSGVVSAKLKNELLMKKGKQKKSSFFFHEGKIVFAERAKEGGGAYYYFLTPDGDFIGRSFAKNPPDFLFSRDIAKGFSEKPARFIVYGVMIALSFCVSGYSGWTFGGRAFFVPLLSLFITLISISLL